MHSDETWQNLETVARSTQVRPFAICGYWPDGNPFIGWGVEVSGGALGDAASLTLFARPGSQAVESADTAQRILGGYADLEGRVARLIWLDDRPAEDTPSDDDQTRDNASTRRSNGLGSGDVRADQPT